MLSSLVDDDAQEIEGFLTESFSTASIRAFEKPLLEAGTPLMLHAAAVIAATARRMIAQADIAVTDSHIVLLAGAGNNGGDGLYAAATLAQSGAHVDVIAVGGSLHPGAFERVLHSDAAILVLDTEARIPGCTIPENPEEQLGHMSEAYDMVEQADLIIDAMTGIGVQGRLRGIPARLATALGESGEIPARPAFPPAAHVAGSRMVLAVDTPSGIGVDDGTLPGPYIPADVTVTFGALKPCQVLPPAAYICGQLVLVDFGFATEQESPVTEVISARKSAQSLRLPQLRDSKYTRSVVGLVTGSGSYPGAGLLSTLAASRGNVGMVRYVGPDRVQEHILQSAPETVFERGRVQSWVVGSGVPAETNPIDLDRLGDDDAAQIRRVRELLTRYDADAELSRHLQSQEDTAVSDDAGDSENAVLPPIVVDAGALSTMPEHVLSSVIITPHAGELARLLQSRGEDVEASDVLAEPLRWARKAYELTGATVLLKGAITVIIGDDGSTVPRVLTVGRAPAWLSTAGSGDVLAGLLGAMLAQNADNIEEHPELLPDYVAAGAYIHALAGSVASGSTQLAWSLPVMADAEDLEDFVEDFDLRVSRADLSDGPSLGHPITASDLISAIPDAYALLIGLYDDPSTIADASEPGPEHHSENDSEQA